MTVVDARTHIGISKNSSSKIATDELIRLMDENGVDVSVVQALPSAADTIDYRYENDQVAELIAKHPRRIFGLACIPPQIGRARYVEEAKHYIKDLGFVALKYHPLFHSGSLAAPAARLVYDTARELGVPVVAHTGPGGSWCLPSLLIPIAKEYKDVTFVMAHSGGWTGAENAMVAAGECPNLLLDTSWHYPTTLANFIHKVGASRIMMATDFPANLPMQMTLWNCVAMSVEERREGLGETAVSTFGLASRL